MITLIPSAYEVPGPGSALRLKHNEGTDTCVGSANTAGIRALMLAVFEDGLRSFLSRSRLLAAEAEYWVFSPSRQSPFSFLVLCDVFGLDPEALRRKLSMLRTQGLSPRDLIPRVRNNVRSVTRVRLRRRRRRRTSLRQSAASGIG